MLTDFSDKRKVCYRVVDFLGLVEALRRLFGCRRSRGFRILLCGESMLERHQDCSFFS